MEKINIKIIFLLPFFIISIVFGQQQCYDFNLNDQNSTPIEFSTKQCIIIAKNSTIGTLKSGNNLEIKIPSGVTFIINNNIESNPDSEIKFVVEGKLIFMQKPSFASNTIFNIEKNGKVEVGVNGMNNIELRGNKNSINNAGEFLVSVFDFVGNNASVNEIENLPTGVIHIKGNINIKGNTHFRNNGEIYIGATYNNNATSIYINCGSIYTENGFNLEGGKIINTGKFVNGNGTINLGGKGSLINNYGELISNGTINGSTTDILYNEGRISLKTLTLNGKITGPIDSSKKGYLYIIDKVNPNGLQIGPNLIFRKISNVNQLDMFDDHTTYQSVFNSQPIFINQMGEIISQEQSGVIFGCKECMYTEQTFFNKCPNIQGEFNNDIVCTKPPIQEGNPLTSYHVITAPTKDVKKLMNEVTNAHLILNAPNKGFIITNTTSEMIETPQVGMLIYDSTDQCIKLYNGVNWNCIKKTCNENI